MRRVWSRGREISFDVPRHWRFRREDDGMVFVDPGVKRAALRVCVWVFPCGADDDPLEVPLLTPFLKQQSGEMEQMGPGHWFYRFQVGRTCSYYHLMMRGAELYLATFVSSSFGTETEAMLEGAIRQARLGA